MQAFAQNMHTFAQNVYAFARLWAGFKSREVAAEELCCSPRHLASIELNKKEPRPEDVAEMVRVYGTIEPARFYCQHQCHVSQAILEQKKTAPRKSSFSQDHNN